MSGCTGCGKKRTFFRGNQSFENIAAPTSFRRWCGFDCDVEHGCRIETSERLPEGVSRFLYFAEPPPGCIDVTKYFRKQFFGFFIPFRTNRPWIHGTDLGMTGSYLTKDFR